MASLCLFLLSLLFFFVGCVHGDAADDLARLVKLTAGLTFRPYPDEWNNGTAACQWPHVTCDLLGNVAVINFNDLNEDWGRKLQGSLDLRYIPRHVTDFIANGNELSGTVNLGNLPTTLQTLVLFGNRLEGTLDFRHLPDGIQDVELGKNNFSGTVDVSLVPASLRTLYLQRNRLSGTLLLLNSTSLTYFDVRENDFSGSVAWESLPPKLQYLRASHNHLSGTVDWSFLPPSLSIAELDNNEFSGSVEWENLPSSLSTLLLHNNHFDGSLNLSHLPSSLITLTFGGNEFCGESEIPKPLGCNASAFQATCVGNTTPNVTCVSEDEKRNMTLSTSRLQCPVCATLPPPTTGPAATPPGVSDDEESSKAVIAAAVVGGAVGVSAFGFLLLKILKDRKSTTRKRLIETSIQ